MAFSLTIAGFPPLMNSWKIRLFVNGEVGNDVIEKILRKGDGKVEILFNDADGIRSFRRTCGREIVFGHSIYHLTIVEDDSSPIEVDQHETERVDCEKVQTNKPTTVLVTELPSALRSPIILKDHFGKFGKVVQWKINKDGSALVEYETNEQAIRAMHEGKNFKQNKPMIMNWVANATKNGYQLTTAAKVTQTPGCRHSYAPPSNRIFDNMTFRPRSRQSYASPSTYVNPEITDRARFRLSSGHHPNESSGQPVPQHCIEASSILEEHQLKILHAMANFPEHFNKLAQHFADLGTVVFREADGERNIVFQSDKESKRTFEKICQDKIRRFLSPYNTATEKVNFERLQKVRSMKLYHCLDVTFEGNGNNMTARWVADTVEVTGIRSAVNGMVQEIRRCMNFVTRQLGVEPKDYRLLSCSDVFEKLKEKTGVHVQCNDVQHFITFTGQKDVVSETYSDAKAIVESIVKMNVFDHTSRHVFYYLKKTLKHYPHVKERIEKEFTKNCKNAIIALDIKDAPCVWMLSADDKEDIIGIIKALIVERLIDISGRSIHSSHPLWIPVGSDHNQRIIRCVRNQTTGVVKIVGLNLSEHWNDTVEKKFLQLLDEHTADETTIKVAHGAARYILEKTVFPAMCESNGIGIGLSPGCDGNVYLKGERRVIAKARSEMEELISSISEARISFDNRVQKFYFSNKDGKDFLKSLEQQHDYILTESDSKVTPTLPSEPVTIELIKGDIAESKADVVVNITSQTNGNLNLDGSAVSRALTEAGGREIMSECLGCFARLKPGDVVRTTAGNLNCQAVFHGVVEKYNADSSGAVRAIVSSCLHMAETPKYRSIAFPAIATGGFRHPAKEVARIMKEEICKFSGENLKEVKIVLYPQDSNTIKAFEKEFSVDLSSGMFGAIDVSINVGDITDSKSHSIVNGTGHNFNLGGSLSRSIILKAGRSIKDEILKAKGSTFRVTSSGNLSCLEIIHMQIPRYCTEKDISERIVEVLKDADQRGVSSISIPAIGMASFSSCTVAGIMKDAFQTFSRSGVKTLFKINVVVFDEAQEDFQIGVLGFADTKKHYFTVKNKAENQSQATTDIKFYSDSRAVIDKVLKIIHKHWQKISKTTKICDDAISRFSRWEVWEINGLNGDKVEVEHRGSTGEVVMRGINQNVDKVAEEVHEVLKEFYAAEVTASFVVWQKLEEGGWQDYQMRSAHILEKTYKEIKKKNNSRGKKPKIRVPEFINNNVRYSLVDLTHLDLLRNPVIKRKMIEKDQDVISVKIPEHWEDMQREKFGRITLHTTSPEYQKVKSQFSETGGIGLISKIERIQDEHLYKQFALKKADAESKKESNNPVTRLLFHGTDVHEKIISHGFDRNFAGKNATLYGKGVYFSTTASFSHQYTKKESGGERRMFLAEVITCDFCKGLSSYVALPDKNANSVQYDSCVDDKDSPTIFVVFRDTSAYPTYLITYRS